MKEPDLWLKQKISRVLVATDLYQNSRLALMYAARIARLLNSRLDALHVFEPGPHSQNVETLDHVPSLERIVASKALQQLLVEAGYPEVKPLVIGNEVSVTAAIIKAADAQGAGLLVIGTEGLHRGLGHVLLGSNTEALMLGTRHPVLTVGPSVPESSERNISFRRIIFVSDLNVASVDAAAYAFALGRTLSIEPEILQLDTQNLGLDHPALMRAAMDFCELLRFGDTDLPVEWFDPAYQLKMITSDEVVMAAASESTNLLVLGVQPATFLQRHMHTSLAYRLLRSAASPVLTVPSGMTASHSSAGVMSRFRL